MYNENIKPCEEMRSTVSHTVKVYTSEYIFWHSMVLRASLYSL